LWLMKIADHEQVGTYIYKEAMNNTIPVIVVYQRPNRDNTYLDEIAESSWQDYRNSLKSLAAIIKQKDFPCILIFEPFWMEETVFLSTDESATFFSSSGDQYNFDVEGYSRVVNAFKLFMEQLEGIDNIYVYIDASNPKYQTLVDSAALARLYESLSSNSYSAFRGISLNVARHFSRQDNTDFGTTIYSKYKWRYILDSSRNGGELTSKYTADDIYDCKYDPPFIAAGIKPQWDKTGRYKGLDGFLWGRVIGQSDGRLYTYGEYHSCLIGHDIWCTDFCPEVPVRSGTLWTRPTSCQCGNS